MNIISTFIDCNNIVKTFTSFNNIVTTFHLLSGEFYLNKAMKLIDLGSGCFEENGRKVWGCTQKHTKAHKSTQKATWPAEYTHRRKLQPTFIKLSERNSSPLFKTRKRRAVNNIEVGHNIFKSPQQKKIWVVFFRLAQFSGNHPDLSLVCFSSCW